MISISEMKLEETTVTRQSSNPSRPVMPTAEAIQISIGTSTQRGCLKVTASRITRNRTTPTPNTRISLRMKSIMSEVIMGTPPRWIPARSR